MKTPTQSRIDELVEKHGNPIPISWSAPLESPEYDNSIELVVNDAIQAVKVTAVQDDVYVNLVTPACHGEPTDYLVPALEEYFQQSIIYRYISQCGCGGHVLRVWRNSY